MQHPHAATGPRTPCVRVSALPVRYSSAASSSHRLGGTLHLRCPLSRAWQSPACRPGSARRAGEGALWAGAGMPVSQHPARRDVVSVDYILDRMRAVTLPEHDKMPQMRMEGQGTQDGEQMAYTATFHPAGSFLLHSETRFASTKCGWAAAPGAAAWLQDTSGLVRKLEFDEHEAQVLDTLVYSSFWLRPEAREHVSFLGAFATTASGGGAAATAAGGAAPGGGGPAQVLAVACDAPERSARGREAEAVEPREPPGMAERLAHTAAFYCCAPPAPEQRAPDDADPSAAEDPRHRTQHRTRMQHSSLPDQHSIRTAEREDSTRSARDGAAAASEASSDSEAATGAILPQDFERDRRVCAAATCVEVLVTLHGGRCIAAVAVDPRSWRPRGVRQRRAGSPETTELQDWRLWAGAFWFPTRMRTVARGVVVQEVAIAEAVVCGQGRAAAALAEPFRRPPTVMWPEGTMWQPKTPHVPTFKTAAGHLLVKPLINGSDVGWLLADTGASSMVIQPEVADALKMPFFASFKVNAVGGPIDTRYRVAQSFQLGPLIMEEVKFAELELRRRNLIVGDLPGPLAGIVGYDVFARTIVQFPAASDHRAQPHVGEEIPLSPRERKRAKRAGSAQDIKLWPPFRSRRDMPLWMAALQWQPLRIVANLPMLEVKVTPPLGEAQSLWFVLDTGAVGAHLIMSRTAAHQLGLLNLARPDPSNGAVSGSQPPEMAAARAPGATGVIGRAKPSASAFAVRGLTTADSMLCSVRLKDVEVGGAKTGRVQVQYVDGADGLNMSIYGHGLACMDLLGRHRVVLDVRNRRVALWNEAGAAA